MANFGSISTTLPGVPATYSSLSESAEQFVVAKGALNKFRIRPQIQNEHAESSREAIDAVDSSTAVGQVFKASKDNINGISLTLQSAATFASMDAITSGAGENKLGTQEYSSDVALQAEWTEAVTVATRSAFTDLVGVTQDGSYALKGYLSSTSQKYTGTLTSTDLTGVTFSVKFSQDRTFGQAQVYFFIGDGTNTKSFPMSVGGANLWQTFVFAESSMAVESADDTATTPTMTAITSMGFRVDNAGGTRYFYADSITYQAEGGSIDFELWDHGTTIPVRDASHNYTADTQYTTLGDLGIAGTTASSIRIDLEGGKRKYQINSFIAGTGKEKSATNNLLTVDNYYSLVLKYVDTNVTVYGPDTTLSHSYYNSGYCWKAEVSDGYMDTINGAAGSGAYSDLMFQIFSTQAAYLTKIELLTDNAPSNNANFSAFCEDSNMGITCITVVNEKGGMGRTEIAHDLTLGPCLLEDGGKMEVYYNDDPTDSVTTALFAMTYLYVAPTVNG